MIRHAGLIAVWLDGGWRGALIEGPSGVGKSDLMLGAMSDGWRLVADDRVKLWVSGGRLFGRAPPALAGLMETRGLGVTRAPALAFSAIELCVRCVASPEAIERAPECGSVTLETAEVPAWEVCSRDLAACAKLRRAMQALGRWRGRAYLAPLPPPTRRGVRGHHP